MKIGDFFQTEPTELGPTATGHVIAATIVHFYYQRVTSEFFFRYRKNIKICICCQTHLGHGFGIWALLGIAINAAGRKLGMRTL